MPKTIEQMVQELYTVILGVPATGEKGMAQLVYDIEKHLRLLNGEVQTNTAWRKAHTWMIGILASGMVSLIVICITKMW